MAPKQDIVRTGEDQANLLPAPPRLSPHGARVWEVDALRGVAIVLMVFYHFMWDLNYFGLYQANVLQGAWQIFARGIATTFIFVMGISMTLSYIREQQKTDRRDLFPKYVRRGGQIFSFGLVITVATYFFIGRGFVIFGILHLLGAAIILAYPLLGRPKWVSLVVGGLAIVAGIYLNNLIVSFPWLIWLGVRQSGRAMVDYYPLLPWFGIAPLGVFAGYTLYPQGIPRLTLPDLSQIAPIQGLRFLGQHSLLIYLTHQLMLIPITFLISLGVSAF